MKIQTLVETADGTVEFSAVLTEEQHKFLIEYAIQDILRKGVAIPVVQDDVVTIMKLETGDHDQMPS